MTSRLYASWGDVMTDICDISFLFCSSFLYRLACDVYTY